MFYETLENKHGLRHDPFKALIVPRPVGWITTLSNDGICNIAPYSFFNAISEKPHYVVIGSAGRKDTLRNLEETGEFTCSLATYDLRDQMNVTSAPFPAGVDEYPVASLTATASTMVKPPRVKDSPAAFECKYWRTIDLPAAVPGGRPGNAAIIGLVVGIHINDAFINDGMVDTAGMAPIARMGYMDYSVVTPETTFTINRPEVDQDGNLVSQKAAE
ncbi:MAG: flavin reductase family protein [Pseudomonadota bacterium]